MKAPAGLLLICGGLFCVFVQFLWTTAQPRPNFGLPSPAAAALVFILGLFGLVLMGAGWVVLRRR